MSPRVGDGLVRLDGVGPGHLRQPQRAVGLPPHRRAPATSSAPTWPSSPAARRPTGSRARRSRPGIAAARRRPVPRPDGRRGRRRPRCCVRALPLQAPGGEAGALVLVRDVTDVRRRDRALLTKDATIREIHHRVKNNLQTVAALLRLQARRMTEPAARAALEESVRRVASIAVVHETLAGSREDVVDVDDVLDQVLPMLGDLTSVGPGRPHPADRLVRRAPGGGRDAAGPGGHRAAAQRRRARLPRRRAGQHRAGRRAGRRRPRRPGAGQRPRAARGLRPGRPATGWACRSCARWSPASWAAAWRWQPAAGGPGPAVGDRGRSLTLPGRRA